MEPEAINSSLALCDFIKVFSFPQCVCVTEGSFLSRKVQISCGDVLLLRSCDNGQVTLSYRNENNIPWTELNVSLDYSAKFKVLPPKDASFGNRAVSMIMYPTIADLLLDCPTYFEATTSYDDPYLPGISVKMGDRFWFKEIFKNTKDGVDRLKVLDSMGNTVILSPDCRGNFCPLKDENEFTIKELIDLAPVQRRLLMVNSGATKGSNSQDGSLNNQINEPFQNENSSINKYYNQSDIVVLSSSPSNTNNLISSSLPLSFSGIVHLLKPEPTIVLSPFDDLENIWTIPLSANLKVRPYSQDDYEIPALRSLRPQSYVPLPLSPEGELPNFQAPRTPPLQQPLVPVKICNFVDINCSSFPVKAKVVDTIEAPKFFQDLMQGIDEIIIYKLVEVKRLYVKDAKSDTVYSLSQDVKLSFIEYPEKFQTISELLNLPIGSEVTVLEDISADFPKTFSLRFGDVLKITSNIPHKVKTKIQNRECLIIKCERIDPEGGDNVKLKLPLEFEVNMIITTDPNSKKLISLLDLINGIVPIPIQNVASVPEDSNSVELKELPLDLRILKVMTETCAVVGSSLKSQSFIFPSVTLADQKEETLFSRSHTSVALSNIGLPLTSDIVLAFVDRLDLFEVDVKVSEADFVRLPLEEMSMQQFEERERLQKPISNYEDIESGSSSTVDENGHDIRKATRTNSDGILERKQKSTKMDKVRRLSRVLNPKNWRHTKAEPEPLPHPSAMGLNADSARLTDETSNEYEEDYVSSTSVPCKTAKNKSAATNISRPSSEDENENFYEDVEIDPFKTQSSVTTDAPGRNGPFSGPTYKSLPLPRTPNRVLIISRQSNSKVQGDCDHLPHGAITDLPVSVYSTPKNDVNGAANGKHMNLTKTFTRAKNWATNLGNNIGSRINRKHKESTLYNSSMHNSIVVREADDLFLNNTLTVTNPLSIPDFQPPLPPTEKCGGSQSQEKQDARSPPIPQMRKKCAKTSLSLQDITEAPITKEDETLPDFQQDILMSINLNDPITSNNVQTEMPKPKPRGLKKCTAVETNQLDPPSSLFNNRQVPSNIQINVRDVESLSVSSNSSTGNSEVYIQLPAVNKPKPPPKPRMTTHTTV